MVAMESLLPRYRRKAWESSGSRSGPARSTRTRLPQRIIPFLRQVFWLQPGWQERILWAAGAWWDVGWNQQLVSFTAQLVAEHDDDADLVDVEPVVVIGQWMGEFVDVSDLAERMEAEEPQIQVPEA
jgi:hypothetical protein